MSIRHHYIKTPKGNIGIIHGSGGNWTMGMPADRDVWQSVEYEETAYDGGGFLIIDARGRMTNGERWRYLGMISESASYRGASNEAAKILDKMLDGVCLE